MIYLGTSGKTGKKWDFRLHRIEIPNVCMEWANLSTQAAILSHKVHELWSHCREVLKMWKKLWDAKWMLQDSCLTIAPCNKRYTRFTWVIISIPATHATTALFYFVLNWHRLHYQLDRLDHHIAQAEKCALLP